MNETKNGELTILTIDPSGTGATGIFVAIIDKDRTIITSVFQEFESKEWKEHYENLLLLVKTYEPTILLYEDTTYVYGRQQQGTVGLFKLIGSIHGMKNSFGFIKQIGHITVNSVKAFRDKIQTGTEEIDGLLFQAGRGHGWKYKGERISLHLVDALMIYHLWSRENLKTYDEVEREITELKSKKRLGDRQKEQLGKLEKIKLSYDKTTTS